MGVDSYLTNALWRLSVDTVTGMLTYDEQSLVSNPPPTRPNRRRTSTSTKLKRKSNKKPSSNALVKRKSAGPPPQLRERHPHQLPAAASKRREVRFNPRAVLIEC